MAKIKDTIEEERIFRSKEPEEMEPLLVTPEEDAELRQQDLQGDVDMDAKYQE
jgi:hypothetical protein